jgi:cystathionine beta-lyase
VKRVNYPGLREHEGFETHMQQANGPGSILSFETGDTEVSQAITEETALFKITVSFGSTHSLISMPCYMSHASIPESVRAERGLPNNLVRISAGVEDSADLLADLSQAMRKGRAKRQS